MTSEKVELKRRRELLIDQIKEASTSGDEERRQVLYAELESILQQLRDVES